MEGIVPEIAYINDILSNKWILQRLRGGSMKNLCKLAKNSS